MIVFGGILEITKESDEVFIYDFASNKWSMYEPGSVFLERKYSAVGIRDTDSNLDVSVNNNNNRELSSFNTLKKNKQTSSMP